MSFVEKPGQVNFVSQSPIPEITNVAPIIAEVQTFDRPGPYMSIPLLQRQPGHVTVRPVARFRYLNNTVE